MERVWQFDFTKASAEFLDFCNLCVREVDFLQQLTVVTSVRSQHLEVLRKLKCIYPCGAEAPL